jgi:hypothetical protein
MPAVSEKQKKFMQVVRAVQKGNFKGKPSKELASAAKNMDPKDVKDFMTVEKPKEKDEAKVASSLIKNFIKAFHNPAIRVPASTTLGGIAGYAGSEALNETGVIPEQFQDINRNMNVLGAGLGSGLLALGKINPTLAAAGVGTLTSLPVKDAIIAGTGGLTDTLATIKNVAKNSDPGVGADGKGRIGKLVDSVDAAANNMDKLTDTVGSAQLKYLLAALALGAVGVGGAAVYNSVRDTQEDIEEDKAEAKAKKNVKTAAEWMDKIKNKFSELKNLPTYLSNLDDTSKGAIIGGGLGLGAGLIGSVASDSDETLKNTALSTLLGAGVGAGAGYYGGDAVREWYNKNFNDKSDDSPNYGNYALGVAGAAGAGYGAYKLAPFLKNLMRVKTYKPFVNNSLNL